MLARFAFPGCEPEVFYLGLGDALLQMPYRHGAVLHLDLQLFVFPPFCVMEVELRMQCGPGGKKHGT